MKKEQLEEGKKIQTQIEYLKEFIKPLINIDTKKCGLALVKRYRFKDGWNNERVYAPSEPDSIPEFVIIDLDLHLLSISDIIINDVNDRINELEKEFKDL